MERKKKKTSNDEKRRNEEKKRMKEEGGKEEGKRKFESRENLKFIFIFFISQFLRFKCPIFKIQILIFPFSKIQIFNVKIQFPHFFFFYLNFSSF